MKRKARAFASDCRGLAAIEFALIAPFLVLLYLGSIELILAFQAQARLAHMASAMADMSSQDRTVTTAQLTDIMAAGSVLIHPLAVAPLGQRISSVSANSVGQITVDWSVQRNFAGGATPTVPDGYLHPNESALVADVRYDYVSTFALVLPASMRFERSSYFRPRLSEKVALN